MKRTKGANKGSNASTQASHSTKGVAPFSGSSAGACSPVVSRHLIGRRPASRRSPKQGAPKSREKSSASASRLPAGRPAAAMAIPRIVQPPMVAGWRLWPCSSSFWFPMQVAGALHTSNTCELRHWVTLHGPDEGRRDRCCRKKR